MSRDDPVRTEPRVPDPPTPRDPQPPDAVVVAVSTDGTEAALAFGVAEARRSGRPLHLVHVLSPPDAGTDLLTGRSAVATVARRTLGRAAADAREQAGDDVVVGARLVEEGRLVQALVGHGAQARVLVMEHRRRTRVGRVLSGSITCTVAGRSTAPVVSVPERWRGDDRHGAVTVGVQHSEDAARLLAVGAVHARARDARLVVLGSWWLGNGYDTVAVDGTMRAAEEGRVRRGLEPVLADLADDLTVDVVVRHHPPIESLLEASTTSDLVVVGRRDRHLPVGSHLGHVARGVVEHCDVPVVVAPEPDGS